MAVPRFALGAVCAVSMWQFGGWHMIFFLAGMQGIDPEVYDSAKIDGASTWKGIWRITVPLLRNVFFIITILSLIMGFKAFDMIYVMTGGGPAMATEVLDKVWALILPYVAFGIPFATLILQSYFRQFPNELIDSAKIDGCSDARIFFAVVLPVSMGAVSSILILNFIGMWNEFLFALVMMRTNTAKTLPVGLLNFKGRYLINWGPSRIDLVCTNGEYL